MVLAWRRVFCTSIPPEQEQPDSTTMETELEYDHGMTNTTPKHATRFGFFGSRSSSNPSTPRLRRSHLVSSPNLRCRTTVPAPSPSAPLSPELRYEITNSPRLFLAASSPRSYSPLSFLKSSLRLCTPRCGLCLQSVKKGQGTATFTAECSHTFHFPCISDYVKTQGSLACPVCSCLWREMPLLSVSDRSQKLLDAENTREKLDDAISMNMNESPKQRPVRPDLKVYNDDEPLASLTPKSRFNPIPESDENYINGDCNSPVNVNGRDVEVRMSPEAAMIATSCRGETYAIVLNVKAPAPPEKVQRRAPIDLVAVVDVSGKITSDKLRMIKTTMRSIVSSLSSSDRLSIVAFSSQSKRLLPLKRMTTSGRRSARCIVEAMSVLEGTSNSNDAVKKAVKVLVDRREKNPIAAVILLSDVVDRSSPVSSIRYSHSGLDIPIHSINLAVMENHVVANCIGNLLHVVVQDLRLQLGFVSGSAPAVIVAVYSRTPQPIVLGSSTVEIGELSANEERELLVEVKVVSTAVRSHQVLSVRCCYRESLSQEIIYGKPQSLIVPRPTTVRSSSSTIQRQRNFFISTRALAESRRLTEGNDLTGAYNVLVSARASMQLSRRALDNEFILVVEAELSELQRRLKVQQAHSEEVGRRGRAGVATPVAVYTDEKGEPLTPISAWRLADKLAKAAMMRKSVNRVGDLHGFEDARF
ncbi:hypothetical protein SSX86_016303 [Deinandra increscens subsp. villosa]|uniref:Uncharacterized protein n=1 Tax=Deinandra increscens subsp. villosa TaxID=3103831 RepID=A0AAP0GZW9_9ASTR